MYLHITGGASSLSFSSLCLLQPLLLVLLFPPDVLGGHNTSVRVCGVVVAHKAFIITVLAE